MSKSSPAAGWAALFLPAPSPGMVVRYLDRRKRTGDLVPEGLLLSDAVGPRSIRVLVGAENSRQWMEESGARLAAALTGDVSLLWREVNRWGFAGWASTGAETERGDREVKAPENRSNLLDRLIGGRAAPLRPELEWARRNRLPAIRIPALRPAEAKPLLVIDYVAIAQLDQKSLLVEDSPRLYRFTLS